MKMYRVDYVTSKHNRALGCKVESAEYQHVATKREAQRVIQRLTARERTGEISLVSHSIVVVET